MLIFHSFLYVYQRVLVPHCARWQFSSSQSVNVCQRVIPPKTGLKKQWMNPLDQALAREVFDMCHGENVGVSKYQPVLINIVEDYYVIIKVII